MKTPPDNRGSAAPPSQHFAPAVKYALITPVRDEEKYVGAMIDSVLAQWPRPAQWVIVDDGSGDATPEIIAGYARQFDFIDFVPLERRVERRPGGEGAIPIALGRVDLDRFGFLARFDADLVLPPNYIASILEEFDRDPSLGIAGGELYVMDARGMRVEKQPPYHVRGALKMYRRQCFRDIGGLTTSMGWDTIDEVSAWSKGWKTKNFDEYRVLHCRPTGTGVEPCFIFQQRGRAEYLTWSSPLFVQAVCYLAGFVRSYLRRERRLEDRNFVRCRRTQQKRRMLSLFQMALAWGTRGGRA